MYLEWVESESALKERGSGDTEWGRRSILSLCHTGSNRWRANHRWSLRLKSRPRGTTGWAAAISPNRRMVDSAVTFLRTRNRESANRMASRRGGESIAVMAAESKQSPK
ncbi:unnamed protein product [Boreogadus saida]